MTDNNNNENFVDAVDDFLNRYKKSIRHSETVRTYYPARKQKTDGAGTVKEDGEYIDRTREIDPRATFNPVIQRHITAKKIRTPEDYEDDVRQFSYSERFEKQPELPEENVNISKTRNFNTEDLSNLTVIPGQQSFFDVSAVQDKKKKIITGHEEKKEEPAENTDDTLPFDLTPADDINSLFNNLSKEHRFEIGKSEKLRAIARTAADEEEQVMSNQLSFPGFESEKADKIDEKTLERDLKQNRNAVISAFMNKGGVKKENDEKIEFDSVINKDEKSEKSKNENFANFQNELNGFIDSRRNNGITPEVEYTPDRNTGSINSYTSETKKKLLIHSLITAVPAIIMLVISVIFTVSVKKGTLSSVTGINIYSLSGFIFTLVSAVFFFKDFAPDIKRKSNKRFSSLFTALFMYILSGLQSILLLFSADKITSSALLLVPAALFTVLPFYFGKYLIYTNIKLCFPLYSSDGVHNVLKPFGDSGLAGELLSGLKNSGGDKVRYSSKAEFVSGFMKNAVNAVSEEPYTDMLSPVFMCLSLFSGLISGIVKHSLFLGVTVSAGAFILSVPTTYIFSASLVLLKENKKLLKRNSAIPSYSSAKEISGSTAIILDASQIIEQNSCSIHGVQTFNNADARTAALYAASIVIKAKSPLEGIFRQVVAEGEMQLCETEELVYEEKLGISTWIDNKRVLFGSLDFMRHHNIVLPGGSEPDSGSRKTVFLAVDDKLWAMFVVSYHIKRSISSFLNNTVKHGMSILINTVDQNITEKFIEQKCRLPEHSVKIIGVRIGEYFRQVDSKIEKSVPVSAITDGKIISLAKIFSSSFRLNDYRKIANVITYLGSALSIVAVTVIGLTGGINVIGSLQLIIFRLFWIILTVAISFFIRSEV